MLRGCKRNMIVLHGTGSDLFEEAYFIVRERTDTPSEGDMLKEAERILDRNRSEKRKLSKGAVAVAALSFLGGGLLGAFSMLLMIL